jgi:DNA-binding NarL/FixJ family response regulator
MFIFAVLVDDDDDFCECLLLVLKELANVQVVEVAQTPVDAISLMTKYEKDWQLLILDIDLRGGNGIDVLQSYPKRLPHQTIFVLTNFANNSYVRNRCLELGVDAVFDKTTELDKFFEHCKNLHTGLVHRAQQD